MNRKPTIDQKTIQSYLDYSNGVLKKAKQTLAEFDDFKQTYFGSEAVFDAFLDQVAEQISHSETDQTAVRQLSQQLQICVEREQQAQGLANHNDSRNSDARRLGNASENSNQSPKKNTSRFNLERRRLI